MTKFVKPGSTKLHSRLAVMEYKTTEQVKDYSLLYRIIESWKKFKSEVGYCSYSDIYVDTRIPYSKIMGVLKWAHKINPYCVRFNVDRMGKNVYFKFIPSEVKKL